MNDPEQPQQANPWAKAYPYSNEPGSQFSVASLAPLVGSLYSPGKSEQAPAPAQASAASVPQYQFGGDQDGQDAGDESQQFASSIGQGVLAASQAGAKSAGGMGGKKKKGAPGQGGDMGGGDVGGESGGIGGF
jgi:hypothetical protein